MKNHLLQRISDTRISQLNLAYPLIPGDMIPRDYSDDNTSLLHSQSDVGSVSFPVSPFLGGKELSYRLPEDLTCPGLVDSWKERCRNCLSSERWWRF